MSKKGLFTRFLDWTERTGNRLPEPITLFAILAGLVLVISAIAGTAGLSAVHPGTGKELQAINLLSPNGIRDIFTKAVSNFTGFAPLGTVLVAMLGVGIAEKAGFFNALLRKLVLGAPARLITAVVVFAGVMSNIATDAGYVVLIPLGGVIFWAFKRHPLAGIAAAFAGVSGGFSANLLITTLDPLLAGLTEQAAKLADPNYTVHPAVNYYFMIASTFVITIVGTWITEKVVEPRLGRFEGESEEFSDKVSAEESKGLRSAFWAFVVTALFFVYLAFLPADSLPLAGVLRNPETGKIIPSPFINGLVFVIAILFLIPSIAYGRGAGTIKSQRDVSNYMSQSMASMGSYIVLAFFAAQFIAYFNWSNLGLILAIKGADTLKASGFTGIPLMIAFIIVAAFINLFIGSSSAKWGIMAPVFVPMLFFLGYSPEFTQLAYRIGDSVTNIITPLMVYFPVIIAFAQKYDRNMGIGTLISIMLPYSIAFGLFWTLLFIVWTLLGLPIGPGANIYL